MQLEWACDTHRLGNPHALSFLQSKHGNVFGNVEQSSTVRDGLDGVYIYISAAGYIEFRIDNFGLEKHLSKSKENNYI